MNLVALIGRMVADAELKYTPSGKPVANIKIAVDRRFKTQSGEKQTDFIEVVLWNKSAEFAANYLGKGRLVAVQGSLQVRNWVKQDGTKAQKTEVVAENIQGLDKPKDGSGSSTAHSSSPNDDPGYDDYDPFADD